MIGREVGRLSGKVGESEGASVGETIGLAVTAIGAAVGGELGRGKMTIVVGYCDSCGDIAGELVKLSIEAVGDLVFRDIHGKLDMADCWGTETSVGGDETPSATGDVVGSKVVTTVVSVIGTGVCTNGWLGGATGTTLLEDRFCLSFAIPTARKIIMATRNSIHATIHKILQPVLLQIPLDHADIVSSSSYSVTEHSIPTRWSSGSFSSGISTRLISTSTRLSSVSLSSAWEFNDSCGGFLVSPSD